MRRDRKGRSRAASGKAAPGRGGLRAAVIICAAFAFLAAAGAAYAQGDTVRIGVSVNPGPGPVTGLPSTPTPIINQPLVSSFPGPTPVAVAPRTAVPETPARTARSRITEIIPPASYGPPGSSPAFALKRPTPDGANTQASADPCVNVFVRSARLDGREVVSVDLHGDGLIKGAVPPHLAAELLARAGPGSDPDGVRAACVSPALAQSLFNPAINVAAVDPAVRMSRVGDRWVLAGSREPQPVAEARAPAQLAAATRGATEPTAENEGAPAGVTTHVEQAKPGSAGTTSQSAPKLARGDDDHPARGITILRPGLGANYRSVARRVGSNSPLSPSLGLLDVWQLAGLLEERLQRAVEAEDREPPLAGDGLDPVFSRPLGISAPK